MPEQRHRSHTEEADQAILNGETCHQIRVVHDTEHTPDRWLIVVDYGWAETIVATCDYAAHARGVAFALAAVLDCSDVVGVPELPEEE